MSKFIKNKYFAVLGKFKKTSFYTVLHSLSKILLDKLFCLLGKTDNFSLSSYRSPINTVYCLFLGFNCLLFTGLLVLPQVVDQTKNEGGVIASSSRQQLFTALKDAISEVEIPEGVLKDIAISPDNQRLYTIFSSLTETYLGAYTLSSTDTDPVAELTRDDSFLLSEYGNPRSLAISRDASLAFIAFKDTLLALNIKKTTVYEAATDLSVVKDVYEWRNIFAFDHKNYTQVEVGPSGKYLYYLADFSESVSEPYSNSTQFGEFGAYRIIRPMGVQLITSTDTAANNLVTSLDVTTVSDIEFAWSRYLVRPEAELGEIERGGSDAFLGPFSMAISPDEDYAIITALGPSSVGIFDPVLGRIPPRDETKGGMLIIDLQKRPGGSDTEVGDYLGYLPTLVEGERRLGAKLARYARKVQHPTVTFFDILKDAAFDNAVSLSGVGSGVSSASAIQDTFRKLTLFKEFDKVFENYGILKAYRDLYTNDMVGASDIGIDPKGDFGLVSMKWTNNLGILDLVPAENLGGYSSDTPVLETFSIKAALEKDSQINEVTSGIKELWPEKVEFTANASLAYVGMRGGDPSHARFGQIDVLTLKQEMASETQVPLSEKGLDRNLMLLRAPATDNLKNPKRIATFVSENIDGDELSDHVEAYNRFNSSVSSDTTVLATIVSTEEADITNNVHFNGNTSSGVLLPRSGLGYRHNEQHGENKANVGKSSIIDVIERVGRIWHENHLLSQGSTSTDTPLNSYVDHPHFVVVDMSKPGWGDIQNADGNSVHSAPRYGEAFNIQYFRTGGSDDPLDFVLSNNSGNLTDNSNEITAGFDALATYELIKLLLCRPEISAIHLDPKAIEDIKMTAYGVSVPTNAPVNSPKVRERITSVLVDTDGFDNDSDNIIDNPGEQGFRRDLDAWMLIDGGNVIVGLDGYIDENPAESTPLTPALPDWRKISDLREQLPYGAGVRYIEEKTSVKVLGSLPSSEVEYKFIFDESEISIDSVSSDSTVVTPGIFYKVKSLTLPADKYFTDVKLKAVYIGESGCSGAEFDTDIVSVTPLGIDLEAKESNTDYISEVEEQRPPGSGVYANVTSPTKTTRLTPEISGLGSGSLKLFFDNTIVKIRKVGGGVVQPGGEVIDFIEYEIYEWSDDTIFTTDVTLKGYNINNILVGEDVVSLNSTKIQLDIARLDGSIVSQDKEHGMGSIVKIFVTGLDPAPPPQIQEVGFLCQHSDLIHKLTFQIHLLHSS